LKRLQPNIIIEGAGSGYEQYIQLAKQQSSGQQQQFVQPLFPQSFRIISNSISSLNNSAQKLFQQKKRTSSINKPSSPNQYDKIM
jgi:hypothetical protein